MRISLQLAEHDRQRLGCPEWMDIDVLSVTAREAAAIQRGVDLPETGQRIAFRSPQAWVRALLGREAVDEHGDPVMVDVPGEDGTPAKRPLREPDFGANLVLVWLALRRAGITVPLADLDFDILHLDWRLVTDEGDEQGKDPEPSPEPTLESTPLTIST